jgi:hypothetical protein
VNARHIDRFTTQLTITVIITIIVTVVAVVIAVAVCAVGRIAAANGVSVGGAQHDARRLEVVYRLIEIASQRHHHTTHTPRRKRHSHSRCASCRCHCGQCHRAARCPHCGRPVCARRASSPCGRRRARVEHRAAVRRTPSCRRLCWRRRRRRRHRLASHYSSSTLCANALLPSSSLQMSLCLLARCRSTRESAAVHRCSTADSHTARTHD